ncbi:MAG: 3-phosphoshikimate 1-carboxyvinyltransferase [Anaerovoracaceae bacterium]
MDCNESGSTFRFLLPVVCALGKEAKFILRGNLGNRPMEEFYKLLEEKTIKINRTNSREITVSGQLVPGTYNISGNISSQYISGLLFALPLLKGDSIIKLKTPLESINYVEMTIDVLKTFGIIVERIPLGYQIRGNQKYICPKEYEVEGDWSNGGYMLALGGLLKDGIKVKGLDLNSKQGDKKILNIFENMGLEVIVGESEVFVGKKFLRGVLVDGRNIPDLIPVIGLLAAVAKGKTTITNCKRLKYKESNRLAGTCEIINALGGKATFDDNNIYIEGVAKLYGGSISCKNDHRLAMILALASLITRDPVIIQGSKGINKSYIGFYDILKDKLGCNNFVEK